MRIILALASLSLGSTVPAQTFVVDVNNGPGTNYTSIQTAVASVPGGSTLIVRAGDYAQVLIDGKGIVILCDPNVRAGGTTHFLTVRNTQPSQIVTVRGLDWLYRTPSSQGLWIENTLGPVTYDGVGTQLDSPSTDDVITVLNASQVAIKNVLTSQHVSRVTGSEVVFEQCGLWGRQGSGLPLRTALPALVAVNSRVQLVHSTVRGPDGWRQLMKPLPPILVPGGPAVDLTASSLRAMGSSSHRLHGGVTPSTPPVQLPSIVGTGSSARVDPQIMMNPVATGIALTRPVMPSLLTTSAGPGGSLSAARHGAPNVWCAMALSLRGPSVTTWSIDPVWLDVTSLTVEAFALVPPNGPFVVNKAVPNMPGLRGFQLVWQAADLGPNGFEFSNPSPSFVQ